MSAKLKAPFAIEWLIVTPKMASEWLQTNQDNRNLRRTTVDAYARDMLAGEWLPNHQGIAFATDGRLLDGQHRLEAIVQSGKAVPMLVCADVPERVEGAKGRVMDTVDRGASRSIPDILRLQHGMKVDANMIAAAATIIAQLSVANPEKIKRVTVAQILAVIEQFRDGLKFVCENRPTTPGIRSATCCGAVAFAYTAEKTSSADFYRRFAKGVDLAEGDAVLAIRNYFMQSDARGRISERREDAEMLLHCIEVHRRGGGILRLPRAGGGEGAAHFRKALKGEVQSVQAIFPDANIEPSTKAPGSPRFLRDLPAVSPAAYVVKSAADVKLTPLAESLLKGKEMSERLHRKIARQEGGAR